MIKTITLNFRNKLISTFDNDNPVTNTLLSGKYWDEENYVIFSKYRRQNTDFIDAGAYIGTASMLMYDILKDNNENQLIYAFEPINHYCTEKNIIDNNLSSFIKLYKVGLGSENCSLNRWASDEPIGLPGSSIVHLNGLPNNLEKKKIKDFIVENGEIEIKTLDSYNFTNIGFIKLDCEGMELDILKGAITCITNNNFPPLFIEIWHQDGWRNDVEYYKQDYQNDIFSFLLTLGYHKGIQIKNDDYIFLNEDDYNRTL